MKKILRVVLGVSTIIALAFSPVLAFAAAQGSPYGQAPLVYTDADEYIDLLLVITDWMFALLLIFAVIMLLWAAFLYLTAGDDEEKMKKAKNYIIYAVIALVIAFVANGVPDLIQNFLGA